jgi:hypothetical protein
MKTIYWMLDSTSVSLKRKEMCVFLQVISGILLVTSSMNKPWSTLKNGGMQKIDRFIDCMSTKVSWIWPQVTVQEWFKAFAEHPRLGDIEALRAKVGAFATLSRGEQSASANTATEHLLQVS